MKIIPPKFPNLNPRTGKVCEMFVYKHSETMETYSKISLLFLKNTTLRVSNPRIITIKNVKLSGHYFYMNLNMNNYENMKIFGHFQICISVPLN